MPIYNLDKSLAKTESVLEKINNIIGKEHLFISITADWCGHCQKMKPEWKKASYSVSPKGAHIINISDEVLGSLQKVKGTQPFISLMQYFLEKKGDSKFEGFPTVLHVKQHKKLTKKTITNIDVYPRNARGYKNAISDIISKPSTKN
jgi:predicted CopG family antitoxin